MIVYQRLYSFIFFFFKQKTAYEMRISDWSSDVCSSDLPAGSRKSSGASSFSFGGYVVEISVRGARPQLPAGSCRASAAEQHPDITLQVRDAFACDRGVVRRLRQDEAALQHRLDMLREADRGDALGRAIKVDRRLNIGGERLAIGVDARLARGADAVARRIGFLHHRADEAGVIFRRSVEHRQPEIDMAEQPAQRIVAVDVRSEEHTSELQSLM